jgi:hypothetical protein
MNILYEAQIILERAGYKIDLDEVSQRKLFFEDDCLLGFVSVYENLSEIIDKWEEDQDFFLQNNALKLRHEPYKAWNAYSVFLAQEKGSSEMKRKIFEIEEDLRGTRKIVGESIDSREELIRCLFPLLPIQRAIKLDFEPMSIRLQAKLNYPQLLDQISQDQLLNSVLEEKKNEN